MLVRILELHDISYQNMHESCLRHIINSFGVDIVTPLGQLINQVVAQLQSKRRFRCGEKLARAHGGLRRRICAAESSSICACSGSEVFPGHFFFSSLLLCFCVSHVLRYFVHWNWCIKAVCSTVVRCNSLVLCHSVCADRSGMAAPKLLERYLFSSAVLRSCLSFASHCCWIALELLPHHGRMQLNCRICTKHCVFSGKRRFRCGKELARAHGGLRRRRFAAESGSICARSGTEGSRWLFSLLCWCCAFVFCMCCDTLCFGTIIETGSSERCVPQYCVEGLQSWAPKLFHL